MNYVHERSEFFKQRNTLNKIAGSEFTWIPGHRGPNPFLAPEVDPKLVKKCCFQVLRRFDTFLCQIDPFLGQFDT